MHFIPADSLDFELFIAIIDPFDPFSSLCNTLTIDDDPFYEDTESFLVILSIFGFDVVIIDPNVARITILDDDCKTTVKLFVCLELLGEGEGGGRLIGEVRV